MSQQENTPKFIKQVPWYAQNDGQAVLPVVSEKKNDLRKQLAQWYDRGKKGYQATNFRKGACENCGAMGHKRKECTERPRKVAAKFNAKDIASDDIIKDVNLNWQAKRDRWNGYEAEMYQKFIKQQEQFESIRKQKRLEDGDDDVDQEFKESVDAARLAALPTKTAKNKEFQGLNGVRNREDFAKYLINLDPNSDFFDPKSRSMKSYDNVAAQLDNVDVQSQRQILLKQDRFASEQVELNNSQLNSNALPTMTQKIYKAYLQKTKNKSTNLNNQHLQKYETSNANKPLEIIQEDENYQQFNQREANLKRNFIKSRYEEDILINDHLSVWGSWYNKYLGWGYSCCHSTEKYSNCLGTKGKQRALAAEMKAKAKHLKQLQQMEQLQNKELSQNEQEEAKPQSK